MTRWFEHGAAAPRRPAGAPPAGAAGGLLGAGLARAWALAFALALALALASPWPAHAAGVGLQASAAASAVAAPTPPTAVRGPITVPDTLGQRLLACTGCHGDQGRATAQGYFPRIAGKPAEYLYRQLRHFREGRRHNATMAALLQPLSDDYLREIAQHFSRQHPPHAPAAPATATPQALARGRQLALEGDAARAVPACVRCHGEQLAGVAPALPALLGLPRDYLVVQLGAWRTGQRQAQTPDCMATIARRLSGDDVAAVAAWLAAQPVPEDARPAVQPNTALPLPCGSVAP